MKNSCTDQLQNIAMHSRSKQRVTRCTRAFERTTLLRNFSASSNLARTLHFLHQRNFPPSSGMSAKLINPTTRGCLSRQIHSCAIVLATSFGGLAGSRVTRFKKGFQPFGSTISRGTAMLYGSVADLTRAGANLRRSGLRYVTSACTVSPSLCACLSRDERYAIAPVFRLYADGSREPSTSGGDFSAFTRTSGRLMYSRGVSSSPST